MGHSGTSLSASCAASEICLHSVTQEHHLLAGKCYEYKSFLSPLSKITFPTINNFHNLLLRFSSARTIFSSSVYFPTFHSHFFSSSWERIFLLLRLFSFSSPFYFSSKNIICLSKYFPFFLFIQNKHFPAPNIVHLLNQWLSMTTNDNQWFTNDNQLQLTVINDIVWS